MDDKIDILNLIRVLKKRKYFLILSFIIPTIIAMIISMLLPPSYLSRIKILAPEVAAGGSISTGLLTAFTSFRPTRVEISTQAIMALLRSDNIAYSAIREFDLVNKYHFKDIEEALFYFKKKMIAIELNEGEGTIEIAILSNNPNLSKDIALFYAIRLSKLNEELKLTSNKDVVKILDEPTIPKRKFKPKTKMNMAVAGISGLFVSFILIFFDEKRKNVKL